MRFDGFDWDGGNREKCQQHGVSIGEIEALFHNEPRIGPDPKHSIKERRFRAIDRSLAGRYVFVVFTFRLEGASTLIRPISARYMHKKEIEAYEKAFP